MDKIKLKELYLKDKKSSAEISKILNISTSKINYWLEKYGITKRSISDAVYTRKHPLGDPFKIKNKLNQQDSILYGIGLGLYWGEGTKASVNSIRLGNSDPDLLRIFIIFLNRIYGVKTKDLRFGLQIFSTMEPEECLKFWCQSLSVNKSQFYKTMIKPSVSKGTYTARKIEGVVTIYYNNTKLRNELNDALKKRAKRIIIAG